MANLTFKTYSTYPPLQATLSDVNGPIDITGASVTVVMKGSLGGSIAGACTITDPINGIVVYQWETGDTNVADTYEVEFAITWPGGGGYQIVPNAEELNPSIEIDASLAGSAG